MKLKELCNLQYSNSYGGLFRLAKGKSPMAVVRVIQNEDTSGNIYFQNYNPLTDLNEIT